MTLADLLALTAAPIEEFQRHLNAFVDEFRRADNAHRASMIAPGPMSTGPREGLLAAVVSSLCRETGLDAPAWVCETHSPVPYFPIPANGYALRVRLMLESPPAFRNRNVFVPENYLSRA